MAVRTAHLLEFCQPGVGTRALAKRAVDEQRLGQLAVEALGGLDPAAEVALVNTSTSGVLPSIQ